ncbi:MAG: DNA-directed RNA polymerase subunit alpha [Elusimicrobiota bacterium]
MKFKSLIMPKKLEAEKETLSGMYGKFVAEPFEPGYGHTIGNSIRRLLLSSMEGAAVTAVKINGVAHEFSVIPGVVEDAMGIILNLKRVRFKMFSDGPETVFLKKKSGEAKAKDIEVNANLEVLNGDEHIAALEGNGELDIELTVSKGRGYLPVEKQNKESLPANAIAVDAIFTPVTRVNYEVCNARVGNITDYDKLIIEIWTDGSVNPADALAYSAKILKDSMNIFINFDEGEEELIIESGKETKVEGEDQKKQVKDLLNQSVDIIELSVRSSNCLRNAKIKTIKDLVTKQEDELLNYKNFGKKSLDEIKEKLVELNLSLGMDISSL